MRICTNVWLNMHVYVCVRRCVPARQQLDISAYAYSYVYENMCKYLVISMCTNMHMYVYVKACAPARQQLDIPAYAYLYVYAQMCKHLVISMCTNMHVYACIWGGVSRRVSNLIFLSMRIRMFMKICTKHLFICMCTNMHVYVCAKCMYVQSVCMCKVYVCAKCMYV